MHRKYYLLLSSGITQCACARMWHSAVAELQIENSLIRVCLHTVYTYTRIARFPNPRFWNLQKSRQPKIKDNILVFL